MFTKNQLLQQLSQMHVPQDSVVTVHTSLKAIGETEGRGEGLLDTLITYITQKGGLLMIPTHTWENYDRHLEFALDMTDSHTCLGTLPDLAAAHPDAHRSEHSTHSVAVFGPDEKAEAFIAGDGLTESCTPPEGCYGKLYDAGGYVLLLGVGQASNTFLHCAEEILGVPNRDSEILTPVTVRRKDGSLLHHRIRYLDSGKIPDVSVFFPKLEPAFRYHGCITDGTVGNAHAMLCNAVKMTEVMGLILSRSGGKELLGDDSPLDESLYII